MSPNTAKNLSGFTNLLANMFCVVSERIFALHHFLTPKNCILEALWKQMPVYLIYFNSFRDVVMCYLVEGGIGEDWINFLRQFAVWALQNVLQFFILIEIFDNLTIFSISILLFMAFKRWNFSDNFDLKGKIGATFLIRSQFLSI